MKKLDTHVHTSEVSGCGKIPAREMVELYVNAGYSSIVITDHFTINNYIGAEITAEALRDQKLLGYREAKAAAQGRIDVLLGSELRFDTGNEDFLLFGFDEEKFLRLCRELPPTLHDCKQLVSDLGGLIYQAHPFRPGLHTADPADLDGVEVYNGNPRHDSHNDQALLFATNSHLRLSSGSDAHQYPDIARGGIYVPDSLHTEADLADFLRSTPSPERIETLD